MLKLVGHTKPVRAVAFTSTGWLVSGGEDKTLRFWDAHEGKEVAKRDAKRAVYAIAPHPAGEVVAYAGTRPRGRNGYQTVCVVKAPSGEPVRELESTLWDSVWALSYSRDGTQLLAVTRQSSSAGVSDGHGRWWAPDTTEQKPNWSRPFCAAFSQTADMLAVTGFWQVTVQDRPADPPRLTFRIENTWSHAVAFVPNSSILLVGAGRNLYPGDVNTDTKLKRLITGVTYIRSIAVSPDGRSVFVGGRPGRLERYSLPKLELLSAFDFELGHVDAVAVAPDGLTVALGCEKGLIVIDAE